MDSSSSPPFHLALPVHDLSLALQFYSELLGCKTGRTSDQWIDFDFFGHQVTTHLVRGHAAGVENNPVDGDSVPTRHFGVVLSWDAWQALAERLKTLDIQFLIEPRVRFQGETGEQATLFIQDPSGNALEFKSFRDPAQLFAT